MEYAFKAFFKGESYVKGVAPLAGAALLFLITQILNI